MLSTETHQEPTSFPPTKKSAPVINGGQVALVLSCCESSIGGQRRGSRRRGREPQGGGYTALLLFRTGRGRHTMGGCGALGRQTVFHQLDMHGAGHPLTMVRSRLRRCLICRSVVARNICGR